MKLPYRCGEWYELPLGDGSAALCAIVRVFHHVVDVAIYAAADNLPAAVLRVSDRAFVLHRWKRAKIDVPVDALEPENRAWITAARAERIAAARLGRPVPDEVPIDVRGLRSGDEAAGTLLSWASPLDETTLANVREYVEMHPNTALRPFGAAAAQLGTFASSPARTVYLLDAAGTSIHPNVRALHVETPVELQSLAARFPNLRALRIAVRGFDLDTSALPRSVCVLDCSHARSVSLDGAPPLRAIRLSRVEHAPPLETLPADLAVLALEHLSLHSLAPVAELKRLEQLELHGLWQFDLADAEPLLAMRSLHRASVDIGGRRKNVELYKRVEWAYPHPFTAVMESVASGNSLQYADE